MVASEPHCAFCPERHLSFGVRGMLLFMLVSAVSGVVSPPEAAFKSWPLFLGTWLIGNNVSANGVKLDEVTVGKLAQDWCPSRREDRGTEETRREATHGHRNCTDLSTGQGPVRVSIHASSWERREPTPPRPSPASLRDHSSAESWSLDFWPLGYLGNKFLLF